MAQESKDKRRKVDEEEAEESAEDSSAEDESSSTEDAETSKEEGSSGESMRVADDEALAKTEPEGEGEGEDEGEAAAQLGTGRYVLAGFFAAAMMGAYVVGRAIQTAWVNFSNQDWFALRVPRLAAVSDDDKAMYGILIGAVISLVVVYRTYQRPDIRTWSDEVASELAKCVWPTRKEVTSSTFVVIVASAVATVYMALLDRLWAFITNIVYGD